MASQVNEAQPPLQGPGYKVYQGYDDPEDLPPKPNFGDKWTRFVCISDTHTRAFQLPFGDDLIHAGDLTTRGK